MANPFDLTSDDPFTAALNAARQGYRSKSRAKLMEAKSDEHLAETQGELLPRNRGAAMSALNWITRPGQVVKNLLTGNLEGAARQAGDFLLDPIDAVLPGDIIPELSRSKDEIQGSQLLGLDDAWRKEHPFLNVAASLPVDILTDPLTFLGFTPLIKGAQAVGKGAEAAVLASKVPRGAEAIKAVKDTAAAAGRGLRSIAGSPKTIQPLEEAAIAANAAKAGVAETGAKQVQELYKGYTPQELDVAGDVASNLLHDAQSRPIGKILPDPTATIAQRIAAHPEAAGMEPSRIEKIIQDSQAFMARQGSEGGLGAPTSNVSEMLAQGGRQVGGKGDYPIFTPGPGVEGYLPRMYKGKTEDDALKELLGETATSGSAKPLNERTLLTPDQVIEHFAANPNLTNVRNLAERVANRVTQQSELAKRAVLGERILQMAKEGKVQIPANILEKLSADVAQMKAVRLGENTAADIAPRTASPGDTLFNAGLAGQSGKSAVLGANAAADLTGQTGSDLSKVYGIGEFSGTAKPPGVVSPIDLLREPREVTDIYGIGSQSGKARPPGATPDLGLPTGLGSLPSGTSKPPSIAASGLDLLGGIRKEPSDIMGLGEASGRALPPGTSAPVDLTSGMGPRIESGLVGEMSGKALPPGSSAPVDLLSGAGPKIGPDVYGIGAQSGKGVGRAATAAQALDPLAALAGQSKPHGDLVRTMDHIMNHEFRLADPESRKIVNAVISSMDEESARYANSMMNGIAPRGPAMQQLAKMNKVIKPIMIYGYVIPKIGTDIRNAVSGVWQAFSNPNTRGTALAMAGRLPSTIVGAITGALGLKVGKDALGKVLDVAEQAMKESGGVYSKALQLMEAHPGVAGYTGKQIASVYRSGAPGGFVTMEGMLGTMAGTPWKQKYKTITEFPARIFKGIEDRMRVGMGLDLLKQGKSEADIGKFVSDSLYSYDVTSAGNRAARDVLPFQQFTFKAVPQQIRLFNEKPWLAVGMASLLTEKQGQPTYPYMEGKLNIPLGSNEQGQPQYISGTGLPFEALTQIPNPSGSLQETGREFERILGGSSQPVLKSLFGLFSGEDPYFESPYGSYSKLPGNIEGGAAGRAYNILNGLAVLQPIDSPLRMLGKLTDDRQSAGVKALDTLTGANVVSVDADKALQQRLVDYLRRNPQVQSYESLYSQSDDPKVKALLHELQQAKTRIKAKKAASVLP